MPRHILTPRQFMGEELVHAGGAPLVDAFPKTSTNQLADMFSGNPLALRQFLTDQMPNQDLMFLGSGFYGAAFEWRRRPGLPASFFDGVVGRDDAGPTPKVVKATAQEREVREAQDIVRRFGAQTVPGLARFFWVKEVPVPGYVTRRRPKVGMNPDKGIPRSLWIICLEKVRPLDNRERAALELVQHLVVDARRSGLAGDDDTRSAIVGDMVAGRIKAPTDMWLPMRMLGKGGADLMVTMAEGMDRINQTSETFGIDMEDLNIDNLGWRGEELVAFDL